MPFSPDLNPITTRGRVAPIVSNIAEGFPSTSNRNSEIGGFQVTPTVIFEQPGPLYKMQAGVNGNQHPVDKKNLERLITEEQLARNAHRAAVGDIDTANLDVARDALHKTGTQVIKAEEKLTEALKSANNS